MKQKYDTYNITAANQGNVSPSLSYQLSLYLFPVQVFSLAADSNFQSLCPAVTQSWDVI